jgi:hypothetical protein
VYATSAGLLSQLPGQNLPPSHHTGRRHLSQLCPDYQIVLSTGTTPLQVALEKQGTLRSAFLFSSQYPFFFSFLTKDDTRRVDRIGWGISSMGSSDGANGLFLGGAAVPEMCYKILASVGNPGKC